MRYDITADVIHTGEVSQESLVGGAPLCGRFPSIQDTNLPGTSGIVLSVFLGGLALDWGRVPSVVGWEHG